ncbi:MAG TPA: RDD family protein [Terriglobales bacterium]|nr:RDD family protein [Terriglobales bacterium]
MKWVTPEGFAFQIPLARVPLRCLAWLVDAVVIGTALQTISTILRPFEHWLPGLASAAGAGAAFLLLLLYAAGLEWFWGGQTVGKRVFGLRVMDMYGRPLTGVQVLSRNLLRVVDALPLAYLVGGISCLATRHAQRLGDLVAGTVVASRDDAAVPNLTAWTAGKYNSFREYPLLALRVRESATPAEAGLVLEALARREQLAPGVRERAYAEIVDYFQARVPFPAAATDPLSAEQYLRNLADLIFLTPRA